MFKSITTDSSTFLFNDLLQNKKKFVAFNSLFKSVLLIPFGFSAVLLCTPSFAASHSNHQACDALAADPYDTQLPNGISGVNWENIEVEAAIEACVAAVKRKPNEPRYLAQLGRAYETAGAYAKALDVYTQAAEQGHAAAYNYIGWMYFKGLGVEESSETAFEWFSIASEMGDVEAKNNIGWLYEYGEGVPQSYQKAASWYLDAALKGLPYAQNNLGWLYDEGLGLPQSDTEAFKWYRKAAMSGDSTGQYNLALMYELGQGVPASEEKALEWYHKSADQGDMDAMEALSSFDE